jgi:hypothetical protein
LKESKEKCAKKFNMVEKWAGWLQTNNIKKPKYLPQAQHRHFGCFETRYAQ